MARNKWKVPIAVATIGLLGTIAVAAIQKWDVLFGGRGTVAVDMAVTGPAYLSELDGDRYRFRPKSADAFYELGIWPDPEQVYPTLDIQVVNNTSATVIVSKAVLEVKSSRPDLSPLFRVNGGCGVGDLSTLHIVNDGWGTARNVVAHFRIVPHVLDDDDLVQQTLSTAPVLERELGDIPDRTAFSFWAELTHLGYDVGVLASPQCQDWGQGCHEAARALREQFGNRAYITGELRYLGMTLDGTMTEAVAQFSTSAEVTHEGCGGGLPITSEYEAPMLRVSGRDYSVVVPVAHVLRPGEGDRFTIQVAAERSSAHEFRVRLQYNGTEATYSRWAQLHLVVPRSIAKQFDLLDFARSSRR